MLVKRWRFGLIGALLGALTLIVLPTLARTSYAHAVVVRAEPAANAQLTEPPHEIRIWFTEPLEPTYSSIELRDARGAVANAPPSYVDPSDDHQLVLMVGDLSDGLYTVIWRNVSSADGHRQTGNYPFVIGTGAAPTPAASMQNVGLIPFDVLARWVNFWGLALVVGAIAFIVFVWQPATSQFTQVTPRSLWVMVWVGWVAAGIGAALLLWNQSAILLNQPLRDVLEFSKIEGVLNSTRFGTLWLWRIGTWVVMGVLLLAASRTKSMIWLAWLATACGLLMLLPVSMYSHAAVGNDVALSIFSDWVHLVMTALWVGGVAQLLVVTPIIVGLGEAVAPKLGVVVAHFSNVARMAVAGLIITGIYATWHQVNTLEALTTTFYGQLLSLKLLLALVLIAVAGVNFIWTRRQLMAGQEVWVRRLDSLVSLEVLLAFGILLVVGAMTAVNPARNEIIQREIAAAIPPVPQLEPIHMSTEVDDLQIHFTATPGWVGNSSFVIQLADEEGEPITDASLIRMRFEHQMENIGESELQIRPEAKSEEGVYSIEGANLSAAGEWRLRMTIQRPDEFDSVADIEFSVIEPPPPPVAPVIEIDPILPYRTLTLTGVGVLALLAGVYALITQRFRLLHGVALLGLLLVVLGAAFLLSGFLG